MAVRAAQIGQDHQPRDLPSAAPAPTSRLQASGLRKSFGSRMVVKDVHLAVSAGEVVGRHARSLVGHRTITDPEHERAAVVLNRLVARSGRPH